MPGQENAIVSNELAAKREHGRRRVRARWPLLGALAGFATLVALVAVLTSRLLTDDLAPASGIVLAFHYATFMVRTFEFHAAVALGVIGIFGVIAHRYRLAMLAWPLALFAAAPELVLLPRPSEGSVPSSEPVITIMSANLMYGRVDPNLLMAEITRADPDVVAFQEWTPLAERALASKLAATFPYRAALARQDAFGQAIYSKRSFIGQPSLYPPTSGFTEPQISIDIEFDSAPLRVTNIHLLPPVSLDYFREQRASAARLAALCTSSDDRTPDILIGDFNATTTSSILASFRRHGLIEAHADSPNRTIGRIRGTTWPRAGVLAHAPGIRLDHAMHQPWLQCVHSEVGADTGSDHAPVIVKFQRVHP